MNLFSCLSLSATLLLAALGSTVYSPNAVAAGFGGFRINGTEMNGFKINGNKFQGRAMLGVTRDHSQQMPVGITLPDGRTLILQ